MGPAEPISVIHLELNGYAMGFPQASLSCCSNLPAGTPCNFTIGAVAEVQALANVKDANARAATAQLAIKL